MKKFENYWEWYDTLSKQQQKKLDFIQDLAIYHAEIISEELGAKYSLRKMFALFKYKDYEAFAKNELYKATEDLTSLQYKWDWEGFELILHRIREEIIEEFKHSPKIIIDGDMEMALTLFYEAAFSSGLLPEYLNTDIDLKKIKPLEYDIQNLRDFDKLTELIGRFTWMVWLYKIVAAEHYDFEIKPQKKEPLTFEGLFRVKDNARKVKEIFESNGITLKGVYSPDSARCKNSYTELLRAFEILEPLMNYRHRTPAVKCFYDEFKAPVNVGPRTRSRRPDNLESKDHKRFATLFASLLR